MREVSQLEPHMPDYIHSSKRMTGRSTRSYGDDYSHCSRFFYSEILTGLALCLVAQVMFGSDPGSGLVHMTAVKPCIQRFGLYRAIPSSQKKVVLALALSS